MLSPDPFDLLGSSPHLRDASDIGLGLCLRWRSSGATHVDRRVLRYPDRRVLPAGLLDLLDTHGHGSLRRSFDVGELVPDWTPERQLPLEGRFFRRSHGRLTVTPRAGRFYPGQLLIDAPGLPLDAPSAFRVISCGADGAITVDFNHPLAGIPLDLEFRIVAPVWTREIGSDPGRAAISNGPGMQASWRGQPTDFQSKAPYERADPEPDSEFYAQPRMIQHLDTTAVEHIRAFYAAMVPAGSRVLDLMSSWTSHLDRNRRSDGVSGLGMNAAELAANEVLSERVVQDLNLNPRLPWPDASFDAVVSTVSVEYLVRPVAVFEEVRRVLKPGGAFFVTFSNRWFPTKAISVWQELHEFERMGLVLEFFRAAGGFVNLETWSLRGLPRPPGDPYADRLGFFDPVYAVWGQAAGAGGASAVFR
jgi:SAM-dependent methyltransferase